MWRRGYKAVSSQHATVVEKLDHSSGALSRTARLLPDLSLLCTLFSVRGVGKPELKYSELELQEGSGSAICSVPLELSQHAPGAAGSVAGAAGVAGASSEEGRGGDRGAGQLPGPGKALVLAMPNGLGTLRFTLTVRRWAAVAGAVDDGARDAGSQSPHLDRGLRACPAPSCGGTGPSAGFNGEHASACSASAASREAVEQRWQQVQLMEQAREDAATIKALQADLEALIQDNKRFKEELLTHKKPGPGLLDNLRDGLLDGVASSRRDLGEQVASLQAELACAKLAAKKEAAAVEERQADAFNAVIRQLADELQQVTQQRDDAWARLATLDKSYLRTSRAPSAALATAQPSTQLQQGAKPSSSLVSRFRTGKIDPTGAACREGAG